jgi:hypothetical protein
MFDLRSGGTLRIGRKSHLGKVMHVSFERYRNQCLQARSEYLFSGLPGINISPGVKRHIRLMLAAFVIAAAAFWGVILTSPPTTEADEAPVGMNLSEVLKDAPLIVVESAYDTI